MAAILQNVGRKCGLHWKSTMLRIKDPSISVPFYEEKFGMKCVHKYHFPDKGYSLYYLQKYKIGEEKKIVEDAKVTEKLLWAEKGNVLELYHTHGSEKDDSFSVANGNKEPFRGFGHIAFNCRDVHTFAASMEEQGVRFQKKLHEGRMRDIAFVLDPDGYWIELIGRQQNTKIEDDCNLSQTMLRVKDAKKSVDFYTKNFGLKLINVKNFSDFSLYFLGDVEDDIPADTQSVEASKFVKEMWDPVLELTHNHGTESDSSFSYHNGVTEPKGFGYTSFTCNSVDETCDILKKAGIPICEDVKIHDAPGRVFVKDPDNYLVEIVDRGLCVA